MRGTCTLYTLISIFSQPLNDQFSLQLSKIQTSLLQKNVTTDTPINLLDDDIKEQLNQMLTDKDK